MIVARIVRAALTGLGAFISELIPAQNIGFHSETPGYPFEPGCDGKCARHECVCPDPAAPDAAAPPPAPPTGDTEPAGANSPVAPAGSTNELAADLIYAAGVVRAYALVTPDLDSREVASLNALSERLAAASSSGALADLEADL